MSERMERDIEMLIARSAALELIVRAMLTGMTVGHFDPLAEIDRMSEEFHGSVGSLKLSGDDPARHERIHSMIKRIVDQNLTGVRARITQILEKQAAQAARN